MLEKVDERTQKYFTRLMEAMGHIKSDGGYDGIKEKLGKKNRKANLRLIDTFVVSDIETKVYQYAVGGKDRYCAELSYRTDIDDYCIETHIFAQKPTAENVRDLRLIQKTQLYIEIGFLDLETEFECWKCGTWVHWLDSEGTLVARYNRMLRKHCGC